MMTGVILVGGQNKRMHGQCKALMEIGGETLVLRQLRLMKPVCSEQIVVTNDPKPFLKLLEPDIRIITDFAPDRGPLGGMHAGLSLARNRDVWIVGSHMPLVSAPAARLLQEKKHDGFEAALPWVQGGVYPLHGVYDRSCADTVWSLLQRGNAGLSQLLKELFWAELTETAFQEAGIEPGFVDCFHTLEQYDKLLVKVSALQSSPILPQGDNYHCELKSGELG
ncbi:molybdenum cofactor guanylyltransferase [Paenibacillus chartarius]|uniref:Molybdenum cofactor guanylyltransferase n=1 Tax=Paenibacillus chartarius TaxID=747481 RepID=A0ABV6DHY4_9BACL